MWRLRPSLSSARPSRKLAHDAALRELEKQRDTIDRLLARHFERVTGDDAERFEAQLGKLVRHKPVEKPE